ncbi:MAG: hypothetical protein ACLTQI_06675 [Slackia sp.]
MMESLMAVELALDKARTHRQICVPKQHIIGGPHTIESSVLMAETIRPCSFLPRANVVRRFTRWSLILSADCAFRPAVRRRHGCQNARLWALLITQRFGMQHFCSAKSAGGNQAAPRASIGRTNSRNLRGRYHLILMGEHDVSEK